MKPFEIEKKPERDDQCVVINDEELTESRSFIEQLLSPLALQRMMMCGGGVLIIGFVGWLWSIGVFENPRVVAVVLGTATVGVIGAGLALFRFTRHEQAGTGLALLGSLALPLNLWFYNAQGLITLADGGHLWVPAAICCGIYALIASVLRKPVFVYTLVGGVVMTGMLGLADQDIGRFRELMSPVTFLVAAGWVSMLIERLFAPGRSDFSREKFGAAFHRAGSVVLAAGLLLLLAGQVCSVLQFSPFGPEMIPVISDTPGQQLWAAILIFLSAIGFVGESFVHGHRKQNLALATVLGTWGTVTVLGLLSIQLQVAHFVMLASIAIAVQNLLKMDDRVGQSDDEVRKALEQDSLTWFAGVLLGGFAAAQFAGLMLAIDAPGWMRFTDSHWMVMLQLITTALALGTTGLRTGDSGSSHRWQATRISLSAGGSLLTFAVIASATALGVQSITLLAVAGFAVPLALMALLPAPRVPGRDQNSLAPATVVTLSHLVFIGLLMIFNGPVSMMHLTWSWMLAAATIVCFDWRQGSRLDQQIGVVLGLGTVWQVLSALGLDYELALPASATAAGLLGSIGHAWAVRKDSLSGDHRNPVSGYIEKPAFALMVIGGISGIVLSVTRVLGDQAAWMLVGLLVAQILATAIAGFLTDRKEWRHGYRVLAFMTMLAVLLVSNSLVHTHLFHKLEIASLLIGLTLLVIGHIGWFREGDEKDEVASMGLGLGSLLLICPLAIGLVVYRVLDFQSDTFWVLFHEVSAIVVALGMFGAGVACRIRSTTLAGVGLLTIYGLTLMTLVQWPEQLKSVSVVMMAGGGLFFATAMLLSIYRDRIVNIPVHIREKRGVFRVMRWR